MSLVPIILGPVSDPEGTTTEAKRERSAAKRKNKQCIFHLTVAAISPNSTYLGVGEGPLWYSTKSMELGPAPIFF
jgi:hypothetical protein